MLLPYLKCLVQQRALGTVLALRAVVIQDSNKDNYPGNSPLSGPIKQTVAGNPPRCITTVYESSVWEDEGNVVKEAQRVLVQEHLYRTPEGVSVPNAQNYQFVEK